MTNPIEMLEFQSDKAMAERAAREWLRDIAVDPTRPCSLALSGGRAAIPLFQEIARQALELARGPELAQTGSGSSASTSRASGILSQTHFFWVDERCVPPDDDQSNYLLAERHLLKPLAIPKENIHRIKGELEPSTAAESAREELLAFAPVSADNTPVLDWVFLGMGEDGHIGSLFPGLSEETLASMPVYQHVTASKPPPNRIALNLAALAQARNAWVFITGSGKEKALAESLSASGSTPLARLIRKRKKTVIWRTI